MVECGISDTSIEAFLESPYHAKRPMKKKKSQCDIIILYKSSCHAPNGPDPYLGYQQFIHPCFSIFTGNS